MGCAASVRAPSRTSKSPTTSGPELGLNGERHWPESLRPRPHTCWQHWCVHPGAGRLASRLLQAPGLLSTFCACLRSQAASVHHARAAWLQQQLQVDRSQRQGEDPRLSVVGAPLRLRVPATPGRTLRCLPPPPQLSGPADVFTIDLRNHGRSGHSRDASIAAMADDLLRVASERAGPTGEFDVLGHSLGGKVAMAAALRSPERVRRLVVADISPVPYDASSSSWQEVSAVVQAVARTRPQDLTHRSQGQQMLEDAGVVRPAVRLRARACACVFGGWRGEASGDGGCCDKPAPGTGPGAGTARTAPWGRSGALAPGERLVQPCSAGLREAAPARPRLPPDAGSCLPRVHSAEPRAAEAVGLRLALQRARPARPHGRVC